jgi:lipoate-protein ligase A
MKYIDRTFLSPAENLAWDEAALELCENGGAGEMLRFYEAREPFVVLGYANQAAREANLDACHAHGIPIFRRCSGGGTVLQGPGCLSYSLILQIRETGPTASIAGTNSFIMQRLQSALASLLPEPVRIQGRTDLALGNRKFSGNAQRRRRKFLIFHGTFLLNFDLTLIEDFLQMPSKQPDYRNERSHVEFLANLNLSAESVKTAIRQAWQAHEMADDLPLANLPALVQKYSTNDWNFKF